MAANEKLQKAEKALREYALEFPETREDFPWGHSAFKVREKTFLFMSNEEKLSLSMKLPATGEAALLLPFASPTGYGLGKSGWVSAAFSSEDDPPVELLRRWIDESFRAVAPKRLVKLL